MARLPKNLSFRKLVFITFNFLYQLKRLFKNSLLVGLFSLIFFTVLIVTPAFSKMALFVLNQFPIKIIPNTPSPHKQTTNQQKTETLPTMIVVLGAGLKKNHDSSIELNSYSKQRLKTALRLHGKTHLPILFSGVEAKWAKKWLQQQNQTQTQTVFEQKSLNTCENVRFTNKYLKNNNVSHVYLVTDAYHQRRARMLFGQYGIQTTPISASLSQNAKTLETSNLNFHNSRRALYEIVAILRDKYFPQDLKECRESPKKNKKPNYDFLESSPKPSEPDLNSQSDPKP